MAVLQTWTKHEPIASLGDSESFKSKINITGITPCDGNTKDFKIEVSLKYLSHFLENFWNVKHDHWLASFPIQLVQEQSQ